MFPAGQIWGNLISSTVFATEPTNETLTYEELKRECGANFDPTAQAQENNTNLDKPVPVKVMQSYHSTICVGTYLLVYTLFNVEKHRNPKVIKPLFDA